MCSSASSSSPKYEAPVGGGGSSLGWLVSFLAGVASRSVAAKMSTLSSTPSPKNADLHRDPPSTFSHHACHCNTTQQQQQRLSEQNLQYAGKKNDRDKLVENKTMHNKRQKPKSHELPGCSVRYKQPDVGVHFGWNNPGSNGPFIDI